MDKWKTATIILAVICLILLAVSLIQERRNKTIDLNGFEIKERYFESFREVADQNNWSNFTIINLKTNKQLFVRRMK